MKISIVGGTAGLGRALGIALARAGAGVLIGSRVAEKAVAAADEITGIVGGDASVQGGANPEVVSDAEVAIVAVPYPGQAEIYKTILPKLPEGITMIDCTVPLASEVGGKPTRVIGVWEGSAAQQARDLIGRKFAMASGFHTVMAGVLESGDEVGDVLVCGDKAAREVANKVVGMLPGARFVDCGPLEQARILESITALLIGINLRYKLDPGAGIEITRLP
ncbi:MAG: NADPH-dependent F420 reductase [Actinobacteria bacterium]|nr:NADPH-dependent F420 reductase [Actinomycetota bacterium]